MWSVQMSDKQETFHATTILTVRHQGIVAMGGDGQVTLGSAIMKSDARKIRPLLDGKVLCGFAGSSADAFALLERFEAKLLDHPANMPRAATELAKDWRTDRALRRLEAMLTVVDHNSTLLVSGTGDVISPTRALCKHSNLTAAEIVEAALGIAADIDIYTNHNIIIQTLESTVK
jgi:ATP-dependent HslUV protease subunit HslV